MTMSERELRALYSAQRADDAASAPEFAALWDDAERRTHRRREPSLPHRRRAVGWLAFAASAAIAATLLVRRLTTEPDVARVARTSSAANAPSIATWRAPTEGLLLMTLGSLQPSRPTFGSVLDGATAPVAGTESPSGGRR